MQASRLLSVLMLLQARGRMTAPALAGALEVSERTILRDIDQLSAAGVPLWGERGRHGGFQLRADWSTHLTGLTEPEANALLLAGLPGPATELGLGSAAASARLKLVASLPAEWREQADRVGTRLHVDSVDWYRTQETPIHLREVAEAVWGGFRIRIKYEGWNAVTNREVEPLGLILKAGAWYMAARGVSPSSDKDAGKSADKGKAKVRTYRLANVLELQTSRQRFKRPPRFDLANYWQESTTRFEAEMAKLQAKVFISPRGMTWLKNSRLHVTLLPHDPKAKRTKTRQDWGEALIPIESIEHGARQFLAYGSEIEVMEPAQLREKIFDAAQAVAEIHRQKNRN
jgi:predicted DNA-binding transcriptional regulator YafY